MGEIFKWVRDPNAGGYRLEVESVDSSVKNALAHQNMADEAALNYS